MGNGAIEGIIYPPTEIPVDAASHIQVGGGKVCVLDSDGRVVCWGWNGSALAPLEVLPEGYDMERVRGIDVD